jgi:hypothetical protein
MVCNGNGDIRSHVAEALLDPGRSLDFQSLSTRSLEHLRDPAWEVQKAAVTSPCCVSPAQVCSNRHSERFHLTFCDFRTRRGGHRGSAFTGDLRDASSGRLSADPAESATCPPQRAQLPRTKVKCNLAATTSQVTVAWSLILPDAPAKPPASMLGPTCALRILAQNSKCYLPCCGDVGTDLMYYFRDTTKPYARDTCNTAV